MKDEISFRSLIVKNNQEIQEVQEEIQNYQNELYQEKDINFFKDKQKSSTSNISSNINNSILKTPKEDSKKNSIKSSIKEYFTKNKQLNKTNFDSFLSFIGLKETWSTEEEQMYLWQVIESKAKNKNNIDYEAALSGINDFLENEDDEDDEELVANGKSPCFEKVSNSNLDISMNEYYIDEYFNGIKNNVELLFAIKFINEIFLKNFINNNNNNNAHFSIKSINTLHINSSIAGNGLNNFDMDKNDADIEGENEVIQIENKNDKKAIISIDEIINDIQNKYSFISINNEELYTYFNNLKKSIRKSSSSNNIIYKNEKKHDFILDLI